MLRSNDVSGPHVRLRLAVHSLTKILVITAVVLTVTSLAGQYVARALDLDPQRSVFFVFDVNNESNIPAGFAALQWLTCAFTLAAIAANEVSGARSLDPLLGIPGRGFPCPGVG